VGHRRGPLAGVALMRGGEFSELVTFVFLVFLILWALVYGFSGEVNYP
jgi:hypothetical protein